MLFTIFEKNQQVIVTGNCSSEERSREMSEQNPSGGEGNREKGYPDQPFEQASLAP